MTYRFQQNEALIKIPIYSSLRSMFTIPVQRSRQQNDQRGPPCLLALESGHVANILTLCFCSVILFSHMLWRFGNFVGLHFAATTSVERCILMILVLASFVQERLQCTPTYSIKCAFWLLHSLHVYFVFPYIWNLQPSRLQLSVRASANVEIHRTGECIRRPLDLQAL